MTFASVRDCIESRDCIVEAEIIYFHLFSEILPCAEIPGAEWSSLEQSASDSGSLEQSGAVWSSLEQSGAVWSSLEQSGAVWSSLEQSASDSSSLEQSGEFVQILQNLN